MNNKLPPFKKLHGSINFSSSISRERAARIYIIPIGLLVILFIFLARLFHLTVIKGSYYAYLADNNRIREITLEGERGTIIDRKGIVLAKTEAVDTSKEQNTQDYPRKYTHGEALAHILGYRQLASSKQLDDDACKEPLRLNDKVGVKGVEALYECHLRAIKGKQLIEVNAQGKYQKTLSRVDPKPGKDIVLSIDSEMQQKAYEIIKNNAITSDVEIDVSEKKVSVVGLDPNTGEVLILLSYPTFNPQDFEDNNKEQVQKYLKDESQPLFNRSLLGTYPPGSVFKPFVAAGALEEGVISPEDTIEDTGFIQAGASKFRNWLYTKYGRTDGLVDMRKGLQRSNDIYFYRLGEKLGEDEIRHWALKFGLGETTGISLEDKDGNIPSSFWKQETIGERWFLGDTFNMAIGQGYLLTTPIQIAHASSAIANKDGKLCTPQLLKLSSEENKDLLKSTEPQCKDIGLSKDTLKVIREGMELACESGGTGWPFFNFTVNRKALDSDATDSAQLSERIHVGCKTGTAESQSKDHTPHAWFTVFAPYDNPEIVLTVMVENAGEGSSVAAPIAKEVLKEWFKRME